VTTTRLYQKAPRWIHAQRKVVEPARLLTAAELEDRVRDARRCPRRSV
jgi:hypothetical protein